MRLPGVAEINGEKLYWGKFHGRWCVSDLQNSNMGHMCTDDAKTHCLQQVIKLFLKKFPWGERLNWYIESISVANNNGLFDIANFYKKILNEKYYIYR